MRDKLDVEIERHQRRRAVFEEHGLNKEEAWDLADSLFNRDRDPHDDRRVCFECNHHVGKVCMQIRDRSGRPQMPLRFILQRCENFDLKGKK
jgi:hypothetical protein